jgi:hypothetical protein
MCDDQVSGLQQNTLQSVAPGVVQRAEEMFPALKDIMVSLLCLHPQEGILQSCCLQLHDR